MGYESQCHRIYTRSGYLADFNPNNVVISQTQEGTSFPSNTFLEKATIYYWRVRSNNVCAERRMV